MATIPSSTPVYQASGLASKLNSQSIIDSLVQIEGAPLTTSATAQTLKLSVDGTEYDIDVAAGTKLQDLATQINASTGAHLAGGAATTNPFTASVMSDGTQSYLTITNKNPGFVVGQPAGSALSVVSD